MTVRARGDIVELDRARVWHPYTSIDAWEKTEPIVVARAEGSSFWDVDGRKYLDGNSSWWVAVLGHGHPRLLRVLSEQAAVLAHCALAGIAHEPAAALAEELVAVAPRGLSRVFYTDNGSSSVEVAVKIAVQTWRQRGAPKKTRFLALDGAFHGDTLGATSLGGVEVFRRPFADIVFDCIHAPFPSPDAYERAFETLSAIIEREKDSIAAVVVEPIVQGAAGMRIYEPRYLTALRELTRKHDVLLVVDEVFAGYGRTGRMWACDHAGITPDIMCLGKAFSAIIPMGATLVTDEVFDAFRGGKDRTLYYGHTFCGNPIGAALAREVLAIYRDEAIVEQAQAKGRQITTAFERIAGLPGVERVRSVGMIGAADLRMSGDGGYLGESGWRVYEEGKKRGAYLRPLGDTVYVCPPLNVTESDLGALLDILTESIRVTQR
ncbi:MAG TPA: adenosylmethionine--8-amino-7-oxononanoate transaminase [Labilithrix sp.]|nr:adenosylmethionine--8-amino-7-oxononanoate transaminase [Labilithrix sp.]